MGVPLFNLLGILLEVVGGNSLGVPLEIYVKVLLGISLGVPSEIHLGLPLRVPLRVLIEFSLLISVQVLLEIHALVKKFFIKFLQMPLQIFRRSYCRNSSSSTFGRLFQSFIRSVQVSKLDCEFFQEFLRGFFPKFVRRFF